MAVVIFPNVIPIPTANSGNNVQIQPADGTSGQVEMRGANTGTGNGGRVRTLPGGTSVPNGGGPVQIAGGNNTDGSAQGGSVQITVGASGVAGANAPITFGVTDGFGNINSPLNGQAVTYGAAIGPGVAAIQIRRWLPVTVDGQVGWLPHFGV